MKQILAPVDFSKASENSAIFAAKIAADYGYRLHLLNIFHLPNPIATLPIELVVTHDELKSKSDSRLKTLSEKLTILTGLPRQSIHLESRNGFTVEEIDQYSNYIHAYLIVMGMKKTSIAKEYFVGSSISDLAERCTKPLLVVPENTQYNKPELIIIASDDQGLQESKGMDFLKETAKILDSTLEVVHVMPATDTDTRERVLLRSENVLAGIPHSFSFPESDDIAESLMDKTEQTNAGLIVMGKNHHGWLSRISGADHTRKMSFRSETPILILND